MTTASSRHRRRRASGAHLGLVRPRAFGIRGRFTLAIAGTITAAVIVLVVTVGAFGARMLQSSHDIALQREASRVVSLLNTDADFVASGSCEYTSEPACTVVIDADTGIGPSSIGLEITAEQLDATTRASGDDVGAGSDGDTDADAGAGADATGDARPRPALWSSGDPLWSNAVVETPRGPMPVRVLTTALSDGRALVAAAPTAAVDRAIARLLWMLAVAGAATVAGAALVSFFVAGRTVRPILRLADATDRIVAAGDPAGRIAMPRSDELGRLSAAIDDMLGRLDEAETARRHLIEDASHDLRSPLTALATNLEILARTDLPPGLRSRIVADASRETADLSKLARNISGLSASAEPHLLHQDYRPAAVVAEAIAAAGRRWRHTRFAAGAQVAQDHTAVGDPELLIRAVLNVLDNAAKYGRVDGTVHIDSGTEGRGWWITVADDGPGIPEAAVPQVFARSYRVDRSVRQPGSGIGLAMARQTAEQHGGTLTATSSAPSDGDFDGHQGTSITMRVPFRVPFRLSTGSDTPAPPQSES